MAINQQQKHTHKLNHHEDSLKDINSGLQLPPIPLHEATSKLNYVRSPRVNEGGNAFQQSSNGNGRKASKINKSSEIHELQQRLIDVSLSHSKTPKPSRSLNGGFDRGNFANHNRNDKLVVEQTRNRMNELFQRAQDGSFKNASFYDRHHFLRNHSVLGGDLHLRHSELQSPSSSSLTSANGVFEILSKAKEKLDEQSSTDKAIVRKSNNKKVGKENKSPKKNNRVHPNNGEEQESIKSFRENTPLPPIEPMAVAADGSDSKRKQKVDSEVYVNQTDESESEMAASKGVSPPKWPSANEVEKLRTGGYTYMVNASPSPTKGFDADSEFKFTMDNGSSIAEYKTTPRLDPAQPQCSKNNLGFKIVEPKRRDTIEKLPDFRESLRKLRGKGLKNISIVKDTQAVKSKEPLVWIESLQWKAKDTPRSHAGTVDNRDEMSASPFQEDSNSTMRPDDVPNDSTTTDIAPKYDEHVHKKGGGGGGKEPPHGVQRIKKQKHVIIVPSHTNDECPLCGIYYDNTSHCHDEHHDDTKDNCEEVIHPVERAITKMLPAVEEKDPIDVVTDCNNNELNSVKQEKKKNKSAQQIVRLVYHKRQSTPRAETSKSLSTGGLSTGLQSSNAVKMPPSSANDVNSVERQLSGLTWQEDRFFTTQPYTLHMPRLSLSIISAKTKDLEDGRLASARLSNREVSKNSGFSHGHGGPFSSSSSSPLSSRVGFSARTRREHLIPEVRRSLEVRMDKLKSSHSVPSTPYKLTYTRMKSID